MIHCLLCCCPVKARAHVPAAPVLFQFHANVPEKVVDVDPSIWVSATPVRHLEENPDSWLQLDSDLVIVALEGTK